MIFMVSGVCILPTSVKLMASKETLTKVLDYGNKFANPGCPNGNCLRSHINRTETYSALAMITKAGVVPEKVFVGVSSYGRSFRMSDPSCTGPQCTFTGAYGHSEAEPGQCTGTGGYSES